MSHDHSRHDSCRLRLLSRWLHSILLSLARGMTDVGVGSGALLGLLFVAGIGVSNGSGPYQTSHADEMLTDSISVRALNQLSTASRCASDVDSYGWSRVTIPSHP